MHDGEFKNLFICRFNYLANWIILRIYGWFLLYCTWLFAPGPEIRTRLLGASRIAESIAPSAIMKCGMFSQRNSQNCAYVHTLQQYRRPLYFYRTFTLLYASQAANAGQLTKTRAHSMKSACFYRYLSIKLMSEETGLFSHPKSRLAVITSHIPSLIRLQDNRYNKDVTGWLLCNFQSYVVQ